MQKEEKESKIKYIQKRIENDVKHAEVLRCHQTLFKTLSILPDDIFMVILMSLSCCEYNVLRMVSSNLKKMVLRLIPIIANAQCRKITMESCFSTAMNDIMSRSLEFGYFSLADWYQECRVKYNYPSNSILFYTSALLSSDENSINWLENNNYEFVNCKPARRESSRKYLYLDLLEESIAGPARLLYEAIAMSDCSNIWYWDAAVKRGGITKLNWLVENKAELPDDRQMVDLMATIGSKGDVSIFEWVKNAFTDSPQSGYGRLLPWDSTLLHALNKNHYHVIKWFKDNQIFISGTICLVLAMTQKMIGVLDWMVDNAFMLATNEGLALNHDLVWVAGGADDMISYSNIYLIGVNANNRDIIKWLYRKSNKSMCEAIRHVVTRKWIMDMEMIRWLVEEKLFPCSKNGCEDCLNSGRKICSKIASKGDLEALKWARGIVGFEWDANVCRLAVKKNDIEMLKWVLEQKCPYNEQISLYAAHLGRIEILEWLNNNGYIISTTIYSVSFDQQNYKLFDWASKNNIKYKHGTELWNNNFDNNNMRHFKFIMVVIMIVFIMRRFMSVNFEMC